MKQYCAGIDVGGTAVKMGIFHNDGRLIEKWHIPSVRNLPDNRKMKSIAESLKVYLKKNNIEEDELYGIGIGVPGAVSIKGYVKKCVNINWNNFSPSEEMKYYFPSAFVASTNDANAAALGESFMGASKGYQSSVLITLGTGVGGGIVVNESVINGFSGLAGEIGHITVNYKETERCNCGNCGCLEQYASATGLVRTAGKILKSLPEESAKKSFLYGKEQFSAKDVCDFARQNDEVCLKAIDVLIFYLSKLCSIITLLVDPESIVIGGGLCKGGDVFLPGLIREYKKHPMIAEREADIVIAKLGNDAGIYGAAKLSLGKGKYGT